MTTSNSQADVSSKPARRAWSAEHEGMQQKESELSVLKGKTAVVTGSTSGIGLGCARAFAGAGADIVLNGIGAPADVEKARTAIENDFGVKAIYSPANMGEP